LPEGGGHRNALPLYQIRNARILYDFAPAMPLRVSALPSLGAYMNIFSIESFMDELAQASETDPIDVRLRHLDDPRARAVITAAAERFGWSRFPRKQGSGRGFAFARYKNLGAYAAVAVEVSLDHESGRVRLVRAAASVDSGQAVNPDGIRNKIEGGIPQSASWALYESITFDRTRITSRDWSSYPILRFSAVPDSVEVDVIDRPGQPFLGTGGAGSRKLVRKTRRWRGESPANSSLEQGSGPHFGILFPPLYARARAREGSDENPAPVGRSAAAAKSC
jgi:CO/xanthine dehydrogenase Mo-binding subunit